MNSEDRDREPAPAPSWFKAARARPSRDHPTVPGVRLSWFFASPSVAVSRWSCRCSDPAKTSEKQENWHVINFIHGGSFLHYSAFGRKVVDPNVLLFHGPRQPFSTSHPFGCGDRGSSIALDPDVLRDLLAPVAPAAADRDVPLFPRDWATSAAGIHFRQMRLLAWLARGEEGVAADPLAAEERILALAAAAVGALCGSGRRPGGAIKLATERFHRERVEAARELMQRRFREPLKLTEIARAVYMSPCHLARVFRLQMGVPIHRYLNGLRLRAALEVASDGGARDLSTLAQELGFSSHSHFTAAFRKEFGTTPSAIRRLDAAVGRIDRA